MQRDGGRVQPVGDAFGVTHQPGGVASVADADQHALARRPRSGDGIGAHVGEKLVVDALGGPPQRQLAERREIAGREEVAQRPFGLARHVDLAVLQPLDQVFRREVDGLDVVGPGRGSSPAPSRAPAPG